MQRFTRQANKAIGLACVTGVGGSKCWESTLGHSTSFGFENVTESEKAQRVKEVFRGVAPAYDVMNDLMSAGMHRLWKDRLVSKLHSFPGTQHLDVAGGTGDIAVRVKQAVEQSCQEDEQRLGQGRVIVCDVNAAMLSEGQKKAGNGGLQYILGDAEQLPFATACMDSYTIAFGIRNVTHIDKALREAYRVLKPGGQFLCLEFSRMVIPGLRELYDAYSFNVIPQIGRLVANDEASYRYLVESIRKFPRQQDFAEMLREAGLHQVQYEDLSGGIVAIHSGFKF